jgi:hypothetical protein
MPIEGFRVSRYRDMDTQICMPVLGASVSAEKLFDCFIDLLEPLGDTLHAVLETSHGTFSDFHEDWQRSDIDAPVLKSHFYEFEDLLLNDGCTGVAVVSASKRIEVQMDEHKILFVYAHNIKPFKRIMSRYGIPRVNDMRLIAEAEHIHHSQLRHIDDFQQLASRLGAGDSEPALSDESDYQGWY